MIKNFSTFLIITLTYVGMPCIADASLVASYLFKGNLNNDFSGYEMTAVDGTAGSGAPMNAFNPVNYSQTTIFDQTRDYLSITDHQGLNIDVSALTSKTNYTIIMDVKSSSIASYNKLISLDGGTTDNGVYFHNSTVTFYPLGGGTDTFSANQWIRVALTYDGSTMNLFYGDDNDFTLANTGGTNAYYTLANTIQLLKDDSATGYGENDPIDIAGIWIYDEEKSLTEFDPAENPIVSAIPEPSAMILLMLGGSFFVFYRGRIVPPRHTPQKKRFNKFYAYTL